LFKKCGWVLIFRAALREKFESEQQTGVLKNERLSLILATYQRNLENTEKKLVGAQQENIDLHIQIKQLVHNSSKLQNQIKTITTAANAGMSLPAISPESHVEPPASGTGHAAVTAAALQAQQEAAAQQTQQYTAMYSALADQIKELKQQLMTSNSNNNNAAAVGGGGTAPAEPALLPSSRKPTPPATPPRTKPMTPAAPVATPPQASTAPVIPEIDPLTLPNNHHKFRTMSECLEHIVALEANSHQALNGQLHKAQQRAIDLTMRNAALEEELASYQKYMRDVVPQYKKQLQYLKLQLKVKNMTSVDSAAAKQDLIEHEDEKALKLPLIK
jgi:hypothetical protein